MKRVTLGPYVWMLLGCVSFTTMYALVHDLRDECHWTIIAIFRAGLAFVFAVSLAMMWRAKLVLWRPRVIWVRSIAGSISLLCSFYALTRNVPQSNALAINNVFPIWVALLAWPMLGIKPSRAILISVVTAVAGVFLIRSPRLDGPGSLLDWEHHATQSAFFALMASMATAVAMLGLNQLAYIDTRAVVAHFSGVSFVFVLTALLLSQQHTSLEGLTEPRVLALLLGVGISATAGQICLTKAFTIGAPAKVSVVGLTQIVMTLFIDVAFFGETFTLTNLLGIGLVLAPTAWVILSRHLRARPVEETTVSAQPLPPTLNTLDDPSERPG